MLTVRRLVPACSSLPTPFLNVAAPGRGFVAGGSESISPPSTWCSSPTCSMSDVELWILCVGRVDDRDAAVGRLGTEPVLAPVWPSPAARERLRRLSQKVPRTLQQLVLRRRPRSGGIEGQQRRREPKPTRRASSTPWSVCDPQGPQWAPCAPSFPRHAHSTESAANVNRQTGQVLLPRLPGHGSGISEDPESAVAVAAENVGESVFANERFDTPEVVSVGVEVAADIHERGARVSARRRRWFVVGAVLTASVIGRMLSPVDRSGASRWRGR